RYAINACRKFPTTKSELADLQDKKNLLRFIFCLI
ncbi:MAG: hypothetical protein RIT09_773, partial [Pseudomonadota bacterium]